MVNRTRALAAFQARHSDIMTKKKELVTLTKISRTTDTEGRVTAVTETSDTDVEMVIQPLTEQDRKLVGRGVSLEGFAKCYCEASYDLTNNGAGTVIVPGDKITRATIADDPVYRVETILGKQPFAATEVFRKVLLRRIES